MKEENEIYRTAPIENQLKICYKCKGGKDHEPSAFGWNCTECGATRQ